MGKIRLGIFDKLPAMHKILTVELLENLVSKGYQYCLSRTTLLGEDNDRFIVLMPVKRFPLPGEMPEDFDTCIEIDKKVRKMVTRDKNSVILVDTSNINLYNNIT